MGCDIHMVVEQRWREEDGGDGRWVGQHNLPSAKVGVYTYQIPHVPDAVRQALNAGVGIRWPLRERNYEFFAALAGVRGEGPSPRGVPDDASDLAKMEVASWGSDGHSHTWYLLSECMDLFLRHQLDGVKTMLVEGKSHADIRKEALECFTGEWAESEEDLANYRLVIWFDN